MPDQEQPMVSHGRGGQGNIGPDSTEYVDGGIVREGPYGDQGDGAYSAGRGGAGNIGSPEVPPTSNVPHDKEMIPELAMRPPADTQHIGRGGQGNVHLGDLDKAAREEKEQKKITQGWADKLKDKLFGLFRRK